MTFRTKVFLIFLITVLASVSLVAYGVTHYTQRAFEDMDAERTKALEVQFKKEFDQRGETVVQQVENITNADVTVRMVLDLARPNADASLYLHDANGAAQSPAWILWNSSTPMAPWSPPRNIPRVSATKTTG